ncbi:MAG: recombinase family protein [Eubacterium sp.]|nr:recombinase family protein [Eubacterium sp.]
MVNEKEARVVRYIFESFLSGKGINSIARDLNKQGIPPKRVDDHWVRYQHSGSWKPAVISGILKNESYIGDSLLQKNYHDRTFQVRVNNGELPRYYLEDHHEGIISRETYERAGRLLAQRRKEYRSKEKKERYAFSGKCICGICGKTLIRDLNRRTKKQTVYWICLAHRREAGACCLMPIREEAIREAFLTMMNKLHYANVVVDIYSDSLERKWREKYGEDLTDLEKRMIRNREERESLARIRGRSVHYLERKNQLDKEAGELKAELTAMGKPDFEQMNLLKDLIKRPMEDWSDQTFTSLIDQVVAEDRETYRFHFKCGLVLVEGKRARSKRIRRS